MLLCLSRIFRVSVICILTSTVVTAGPGTVFAADVGPNVPTHSDAVRLADQAHLTKIAMTDSDANVRYDAAGQILDLRTLRSIAHAPCNKGTRMGTIADLRQLLDEARILPANVRISLSVEVVSKDYSVGSSHNYVPDTGGETRTVTIRCESVRVAVKDGEKTIVEHEWPEELPDNFYTGSETPTFLFAPVKLIDLITGLPDKGYPSSQVQLALARIAAADSLSADTFSMITDQAALAEVATYAKDDQLRDEAMQKLTGEALRAKVMARREAREGGVSKVRAVLKANPKAISCTDQKSLTSLHRAAKNGYKDIVALLLSRKAKVNARDDHNQTPLLLAAEFGYADVAKLLISCKADANAKDWLGRTPLHYAALNDLAGVAELLIQRGCNVNAKDDDGRTALSWAVEDGCVEVVRALLASKADVNAKDNLGRAPLYFASENNLASVARLLILRGCDVNVKENDGRTALSRAAEKGYTEVARILLANKANVNAKDKLGQTPLHYAVESECKDLVELLVLSKADVNAKNNEGQTPLDLVRWREDKDIKDIKELLRGHGKLAPNP